MLKKDHPYANRIIQFEMQEDESLKEIHIDASTNKVLSREYRVSTLPSFRFEFPEERLLVEIRHQFLDTIDFKGFTMGGIDIETIALEIFDIDGNSKQTHNHTSEVNQSPYEYEKMANNAIKQHVQQEENIRKHVAFLSHEYRNFSRVEKVRYLYGQVLFEDRMQGGYPSGFSSPVASYISKWFVDSFSAYDDNYTETIIALINKFNIECTDVDAMLKLSSTSSEWKVLAERNNLLS